jgi:hypothetical protein
MDEKPKSIWKKSWNLPGSFLGWLVLVTFIASGISLLAALIIDGVRIKEDLGIVAVVTTVAVAGALIFLFLRWLCSGRNFKRFLFGLAWLATLIALFYTEENWRGKHDWEKFKREWEAKGEHFDFASVVPPPVPDDQNFAMTPVVASCYEYILDKNGHKLERQNTNVVNRLQMNITRNNDDSPTNSTGHWQQAAVSNLKTWQNYYRAQAATTNEFPTAPQPQSPAQDVLLALSKYNPAIEELRQASQLPYSRFPLNYDTDFPGAILLPHLAALKRCVQVLQLRAIAELQNGQSEKALDDVKLMLRLTDSIRAEPFLICHLVRIAMVNLTLQPVWEGLAEHQWSEAQLGELDQALAKIDLLTDYGVAMRGERALGIGVIEFLQHKRSIRKLAEVTSDANGRGDDNQSLEPAAIAIIYRFGPSGWFDQNKLRIARFETKWYLPLADAKNKVALPKSAERAEDAVDQEHGMNQTTPFNWFEKMVLPSLASAVKKFAIAQSSVDLARTAIALERYRLAHGEYPESLDVLAPQFIAQVPHDVIGGQPLKYRRTDDGQFVLYSVGWNETDDGGVVAFRPGKMPTVDINEGDWVWRYPAR